MSALALMAFALVLTNPPALSATKPTAPIVEKWNTVALVKIALTPNYNAGFGQIPAVIGTQPAPTHGPDAMFDGGSVDFGNVLAGKNYIYKYAAHLNVQANAPTGVYVYGEGAADFVCNSNCNSSGGGGITTVPLNEAIYYLTSVAAGDVNTGFSASTPFFKTGAMVTNNSYATTPVITYATYPAPIAQSNTGNTDFYWDYQLKVPINAANGNYYVWIVYTVVPK